MPSTRPNLLPFIGQTLTVRIDRPAGSRHPSWGFLYPVNYGFLPGVPGGDGDDQDAYVLGVQQPLLEFTGLCIAVIRRLDDAEDKLVVVPPEAAARITDDDIRAWTDFQETSFTIQILRH